MKGVEIDGFSDERWHDIIKGVDLTLHRGEVLGLIGESGAGKSTLGLAAMGFARPGCRIKAGEITLDGIDLRAASEPDKRRLWGSRMAYVAQSAANVVQPGASPAGSDGRSDRRSRYPPERRGSRRCRGVV